MPFEKNVFINCPFDPEYNVLLKPLVFTLLYLGFEPKLSDNPSSGIIRIKRIMELIRGSLYSIHDISRSQALKAGEMPRFNMPYEMGLDIGCQEFGTGKLKNKKCLILDSEKNRYDTVISDISGQDIKDHGNDPQQLIAKVRDWFVNNLQERQPSRYEIWEHYTECITDMAEELTSEGYSAEDIDSVPVSEFIIIARRWIAKLP